MAMSNWDVMAWDDEGNLIPGEKIFGSVAVKVYKNWVRVSREEDDLVVIDKVKSADLRIRSTYDDEEIMARKMKEEAISTIRLKVDTKEIQNSVFLAATMKDYEKDETENMYAIGVYAYEDEDKVGVKEETYDKYMEWLGNHKFPIYIREPKKRIAINQGDLVFSEKLKFDPSERGYIIGEDNQGTLMGEILDDEQTHFLEDIMG